MPPLIDSCVVPLGIIQGKNMYDFWLGERNLYP